MAENNANKVIISHGFQKKKKKEKKNEKNGKNH